jgi:hypothetical protein
MRSLRRRARPALRFRVFLGGELASERWIHAGRVAGTIERLEPGGTGQHGRRLLIEIYDPAAPDDRVYVRFGTGPDGRVVPVAVIMAAGPPPCDFTLLDGGRPGRGGV